MQVFLIKVKCKENLHLQSKIQTEAPPPNDANEMSSEISIIIEIMIAKPSCNKLTKI